MESGTVQIGVGGFSKLSWWRIGNSQVAGTFTERGEGCGLSWGWPESASHLISV